MTVYTSVALFASPIILLQMYKRWNHSERIYMDRSITYKQVTYNHREIPKLIEHPTELIWGSSLYMCVYQMGVAHAICSKIKHQKLLSNILISGVSGGSVTALSMTATLHGVGDMQQWYEYYLRKMSIESSYYNCLWRSQTAWHCVYESMSVCYIFGMKPIDWETRCKVFTTELTSWKLKILNTFPNAHSLADAVTASSFIPLIMSPFLYFLTRDSKTNELVRFLDGGFTFNFKNYNPSNDVVNFSFFHNKIKHLPSSSDGFTRTHYSISNGGNYIMDNFKIISDVKLADELFKKGYEFGCINLPEIKSLLKL